MTDRYRYGLENLNWHRKWPIDISVVPTQTEHKLIGRWPIDKDETLTETDKTNDWSI